ncbi:MAG TPA: EAL domain-containing protein [Acidimicrobiales bacterium]|nr:EAL domain-containing protein [Acidimicrobiales bacterium]
MALLAASRRIIGNTIDYLPKGQALAEDVWRVRHRTLLFLLRAHVVVIFCFGLFTGHGLVHSVEEAAIVAMFAVFASAGSQQRFSSAMAALGLVTSSAVLVHLSGGMIELHFHFFVMVGILTLYQDWIPFLVAIGFVVAHHATMGILSPSEVYNHPDAIAHPFKWALIHGGFVLAASVASIVAWRLNEEQALHDSLTHLPNRKLFQDRVGHALARAQRSPNRTAVLFVDLDEFKNVNDSLGHAAGDQLLVTVSERIRASIRPADTAARLGGDEFAILVEDVTGEADAAQVAQRILDALSVPFVLRGKELPIGASIGIAMGGPAETMERILRNADVAMYTAKNSGRGRYELFRSSMHEAVVERVELEQGLQRAAERDELVLHYQPVISLATGRMVGFEALLRWEHPERGLLAPGAFIDVAEETGAIVPMGIWALQEACNQAREWKDRHPHQSFTIAVNLSPKQLFQPDVVDVVRDALATAGLAPSDLVLELTEGVMVKDTLVTVERLHALKAIGVKLAIDDFGTGYSSLSYLRRLPFDILKIDKLFIDGIAAGRTESAFALAIIKLAQTLGLETVGEGVESAAQVAHLRQLGCELAQGYHFAKPLTGDGAAALLAATERDGWLRLESGVELGLPPAQTPSTSHLL